LRSDGVKTTNSRAHFRFLKKDEFLDFLDFWLYRWKKESYWRSTGVKMIFEGFLLLGVGVTGYLHGSLSLSAPKGSKGRVKGTEGPPTRSQGPEGPKTSSVDICHQFYL